MGKSNWNTGDMCPSWKLDHHLTLRNSFIEVLRYYSVTDKSTSSGKSYKIYASRIYAPTIATMTYSSLLYTAIWYVGVHNYRKKLRFFSLLSPVNQQDNGHTTA